MRIAIVSDIHGNRTAFEAVLKDLRETAPDLILHGGDLPHGGSSPAWTVDQIRDLGWPGVLGNTDEMLFAPESLADFASRLPNLKSMFDTIAVMAAATREALGEERIQWLKGLPRVYKRDFLALLHASPESTWRAPAPEAGDEELSAVYTSLGRPVVVYGHIHRSYVRKIAAMTIANSGSVSLSFDGDRRAAYLLLDELTPSIRRVEYDVDREVKLLSAGNLPHSDWIARSLLSARPEMP